MATPPPPPRLCHLVKLPTFEGFGFNLYAEKKKPGQYIGEIDSDSPAEAAGLKEGDRIIEVNGVNVNLENHRQVVQRIKAVAEETRLLVVDEKSADWHRERRVLVKASLPYVIQLSSEKADKSDHDGTERPSANHNEVFEEVTGIDSSPQTSSRSTSVCSLPSVEVGEQFKTEISISVTFSDEGSEDPPEMLNGGLEREAREQEAEDRVAGMNMSDEPATDVDVVTAGSNERIFTAEKVETNVTPRSARSSVSVEKEEKEIKFEDVEVDESEAYAAFFSNDRVAENNGQDDTGRKPPKQEDGEEITIIETNGPASGVDLVVANPDLEDPRQSPKESESGETRQESSDSEQVSLEETVEELSHLEVGTNEEILMESAKEEEDGSDRVLYILLIF